MKISHFLADMSDKQPAEEKVTFTKENKSSLGKRKNSKPLEDNSNDGSNLDSVVMSEPRKKIPKLTHSNSVEKQPSFVQTKMACVIGFEHTTTLSIDGTAHSFGRNNKGQLGLGHNNDVSLPTPIPNLPQISLISGGFNFTVCVDYEGFVWSFGENKFQCSSKTFWHSSCSFCFLWNVSHIDPHR